MLLALMLRRGDGHPALLSPWPMGHVQDCCARSREKLTCFSAVLRSKSTLGGLRGLHFKVPCKLELYFFVKDRIHYRSTL